MILRSKQTLIMVEAWPDMLMLCSKLCCKPDVCGGSVHLTSEVIDPFIACPDGLWLMSDLSQLPRFHTAGCLTSAGGKIVS